MKKKHYRRRVYVWPQQWPNAWINFKDILQKGFWHKILVKIFIEQIPKTVTKNGGRFKYCSMVCIEFKIESHQGTLVKIYTILIFLVSFTYKNKKNRQSKYIHIFLMVKVTKKSVLLFKNTWQIHARFLKINQIVLKSVMYQQERFP